MYLCSPSFNMLYPPFLTSHILTSHTPTLSHPTSIVTPSQEDDDETDGDPDATEVSSSSQYRYMLLPSFAIMLCIKCVNKKV